MRTHNTLADKNQTIRILLGGCVVLLFIAVFSMAGWYKAPKHQTFSIRPELSMQGKGYSVVPNEYHDTSVYHFALYMWQQLNRWEKDGRKDYSVQIDLFRNYLTPECHADRLAHVKYKNGKGELDRIRTIKEIPGRGFDNTRVKIEQVNEQWIVSLDILLDEYNLRTKRNFKTRYISYQLRVVAKDIDPQKNAYGLLLDCEAEPNKAIPIKSQELTS